MIWRAYQRIVSQHLSILAVTEGVVAILLALAPSPIFGDIFNPGVQPIGEVEALMANSGVAYFGSPSNAYYNPGALAFSRGIRLSVGANTYSYQSFEADKYARFDGQDVGYQTSNFNAIPSTAVSTLNHFGFVQALSFFSEREELHDRIKWDTQNTNSNLLSSSQNQQLRAGVSFADKLTEKVGLGISIFGIRYLEQSISSLSIEFDNFQNSATSSIVYDEIEVYGLQASFGIAYRFSEDIDFGFRVQSPLAKLHGSSSMYQNEISFIGGQRQASATIDEEETADYNLPVDMAWGARFQLFDGRLNSYTDLGLQFPLSYRPSSRAEEVKVELSPRLNTGLEYQVLDSWQILSGFSYIPSASPKLTDEQEGHSRLDYYNGSLGVRQTGENHRLGLGALVSWANGELVPILNPSQRTSASAFSVGMIVTASYQL